MEEEVGSHRRQTDPMDAELNDRASKLISRPCLAPAPPPETSPPMLGSVSTPRFHAEDSVSTVATVDSTMAAMGKCFERACSVQAAQLDVLRVQCERLVEAERTTSAKLRSELIKMASFSPDEVKPTPRDFCAEGFGCCLTPKISSGPSFRQVYSSVPETQIHQWTPRVIPTFTTPRDVQKIGNGKEELQMLRKWEEFTEGLLGGRAERNGSREVAKRDELPKTSLQLRPAWMVGREHRVRERNGVSLLKTMDSTPTQRGPVSAEELRNMVVQGSWRHMGSVLVSDSPMQRFVIHPDKMFAQLHSILQGILIMYDVIFFPMMVFFNEDSASMDFFNTMMVITTVFWTVDLPLNFLQGYHSPQGMIEMRIPKIAVQYMRRWFLFDLFITCIDWCTLIFFILETTSSDAGFLRMGKSIKATRVLRAGRVLRLVKTLEKVHALLDVAATSEVMLVVARIIGLIMFILLVNHYVACAWYGMGQISHGAGNWIDPQFIENSSTFNKYFTALHWSLTQFTPSTNNINPVNAQERFFACLVVLFALIMFSTFLSSLTSATMQIKNMNFERLSEENQIREFLSRNEVPLDLGKRIWSFYRQHYRKRNKVAHEADISFFKVIPKSLKLDLHKHIYVPILTEHPVFWELMKKEQRLIIQLCQTSVKAHSYMSGQELFLSGELAKQVIWLRAGELSYSSALYRRQITVTSNKTLISEPALWCKKWEHVGRLAVENTCAIAEVIYLDVTSFEDVFSQSSSDMSMRSLCTYAGLFVQHMEDCLDSALRRTNSRKSSLPPVCAFDSGTGKEKRVRIGGASETKDDVNEPSSLATSKDEAESEMLSDIMLNRQVLEDMARRAFAEKHETDARTTGMSLAFSKFLPAGIGQDSRSSKLKIPTKLGRLVGLLFDSKDPNNRNHQGLSSGDRTSMASMTSSESRMTEESTESTTDHAPRSYDM